MTALTPRTALSSLARSLRARLGPLWPYLVLIGLPTAVFALPDLFGGRLLMVGDNLQQNYPLHVLTGSFLSHGELPLWNQYMFSGTPLLAGFNAGAFHPLVGLFVILPDRAAWIATEAILFSCIGVGTYLYLRALRISARPAVLAALVFTFAGTVFSQVNHVDMTEGFAALPFMLLAILRILESGRWRWSIVLGIGFATVIFGGAPEAMLDEALLVLIYAVVTAAGRDRTAWWRLLSRAGTAAALALSLAAVQWLPGLSAISSSERSGLNGPFAGFGNFLPPFGFLSVVPNLFGGYGHLGMTQFFSRYNLPEVGIYLGILPIVALVALANPRWPSRLARRDRLTWFVVGAIGLLLALGPVTPLEHLFNSIPLYGRQRLQSRNMVDVSMAISVLFAGWLDRDDVPVTFFRRFDRLTGAIPAGVVGVLCLIGFAGPTWFLQTFGYDSNPTAAQIHTVREATLIALGFSLAAGAIVWLRARLSVHTWFSLAAVFTLVDVGLIAATGQLATFPPNAVVSGNTAIEQFVSSNLVPNGRYVLYDPENVGINNEAAGLWDLNVLAGLPSVSGYGSIVNGNYSNVTNTHSVGDLNVSQLDAGSLDSLDLQDVITMPEYLLFPIEGQPTKLSDSRLMSEPSGVDPVLPFGSGGLYTDAAYSFYPGPRQGLRGLQTRTSYFGETLQPGTSTLLFTAPAAVPAVLRFGSLELGGATKWGPAVQVQRGATSVTGAMPKVDGVAMTVQVIIGSIRGYQSYVTVGGHAYELDGSLSAAVQPPTWRTVGTVGGYTLFVRQKAPTPISSLDASGHSGPTPRVLTNLTKTETVRVSATGPLTIVRDVAYDAGWRGTVRVNGGPTRSVTVTRHGLVQQVKVPAGDDVVTFTYMPPHWRLASVLSLGAVGVLFVLLLGAIARSWRRRNRRPRPPSTSTNPDPGRELSPDEAPVTADLSVS